MSSKDDSIKSKRKNESDHEDTSSNSDNSQEETSGKNSSKKLKIPIKLSLNASSASKQAADSISKTMLTAKSDTNSTKSNEPMSTKETETNDKSNSRPSPVVATVPKLPTGNLAPSKKQQPVAVVKNISDKVAKAFGSDSEEETEMPFEAKMKMRNVGRETKTSQGPNSYGKTSLGFTDQRKLFEKQLKEKADQLLREEAERMAKKKQANS